MSPNSQGSRQPKVRSPTFQFHHQTSSMVGDKTKKHIKDLISADVLNHYTRLVLINAIYFKGTWKNKFNTIKTTNEPFYVTPTTTVDVPMMNKKSNYRYGIIKELKAQLLEMPYENNGASMVIILPEEKNGLDSLLQKLAEGYDLLEDLSANLLQNSVMEVRVTIPRFKIETEIDLGVLLPKIGIAQIFDENNSGLTKILNSDEPLYVSKAIQKAFIEVNEDGVKAAAATGNYLRKLCSSSFAFRANRPFLYLLLHKQHIVLFIGVFNGK
ncbi:hypothetical protein evm_004934 [Chilo suppressalis]|nr:hypothetical protein evm_004934 [Chilo suppressalis]